MIIKELNTLAQLLKFNFEELIKFQLYKCKLVFGIWQSKLVHMANLKYLYIVVLCLGMMSCVTSKSYYKKGLKLDEVGMTEEAAEYYIQALSAKRTNVKAKIALKQTGQKALNDMLDKFNKMNMLEDHINAVYAFEDAQLFYERVELLGVKLEIPKHYNDRFDKSLVHYKDKLYNEGIAFYEAKNYDEATRKFEKIASYDPLYKDIEEYKSLAFSEPLYDKGITAFEREEWRKAFGYFDQIHRKNPDFRDVHELWENSLDYGTFPVAIVQFENGSSNNVISERIHSIALERITNIDNPFIKVVDRENMDQVIEEQTLGLSGVVDEATAAQVGKILGAKGMITGEIIAYKEIPGKLRKKTFQAFEAYDEKITNEEGKESVITRYRPAKYQEYYNKNEVSISVQYKCTSLETGQIIFSKVYEETISDEIHYAVYGGKHRNLIPAKDNNPSRVRSEYNALQSLLKSRRELVSIDKLGSRHFDEVAVELAKQIEDYLEY